MTTSERDGCLKQYELFRAEILHYDHSLLQVLTVVLGFIGVVTAQGFASAHPYIFVVPLPLLSILALYVSDKRWAIWLIASYIRTYLEKPEYGIQWETRLYWFRTACKEKESFKSGHNIIKIECMTIVLLGITEYGLFCYFAAMKSYEWWTFILPSAALGLLLWQVYRGYCRLMREGQEGDYLTAIWKRADQVREEAERRFDSK